MPLDRLMPSHAQYTDRATFHRYISEGDEDVSEVDDDEEDDEVEETAAAPRKFDHRSNRV